MKKKLLFKLIFKTTRIIGYKNIFVKKLKNKPLLFILELKV